MPQKTADKKLKAEAMKAMRDTRTPQQQLEILDKKLGKGVGAKRERARLAAQIGEKK